MIDSEKRMKASTATGYQMNNLKVGRSGLRQIALVHDDPLCKMHCTLRIAESIWPPLWRNRTGDMNQARGQLGRAVQTP